MVAERPRPVTRTPEVAAMKPTFKAGSRKSESLAHRRASEMLDRSGQCVSPAAVVLAALRVCWRTPMIEHRAIESTIR
jgi:hypothetical protein